ncbi:endonuclease/exonuclease/phosphatase family protein [Leifsonia sp. 21MFCrub1.1]|uniref:endonuclease/exonuclease/phosphatase family protein n=1 Tax=Leifsonia sp. 21MFCrub1.1 TaxID=1798223 RepID=UPI0008928122|nr:endonuclease/exonuclease/phosphatase family protein [Leifsonia sp. 21MFCrub1.1]SEB09714.1 Endonuclease/Exonuclease/phosphatase family protein [Leifsonia sp. 21MFCrub1.1]
MSIRTLTWNVLYRDRRERAAILADYVTRIRPDVVMLQETSPADAAALAHSTGLRLAAVPDVLSDADTSVPALLTSAAFREPSIIELPHPQQRHYYGVTATVHHDGADVQAASAHLRHTWQAGRMGCDDDYRAAARGVTMPAQADTEFAESVNHRLDQLTSLLAALDETETGAEARLLAGDMNFVPDGPEYNTIVQAGWVDAWRAAPRLGSGATILDTNPLVLDNPRPYRDYVTSLMPGSTSRLDYTLDFHFSRGSVSAGRAWVVGEPENADTGAWPSDHLGIVVDYHL